MLNALNVKRVFLDPSARKRAIRSLHVAARATAMDPENVPAWRGMQGRLAITVDLDMKAETVRIRVTGRRSAADEGAVMAMQNAAVRKSGQGSIALNVHRGGMEVIAAKCVIVTRPATEKARAILQAHAGANRGLVVMIAMIVPRDILELTVRFTALKMKRAMAMDGAMMQENVYAIWDLQDLAARDATLGTWEMIARWHATQQHAMEVYAVVTGRANVKRAKDASVVSV